VVGGDGGGGGRYGDSRDNGGYNGGLSGGGCLRKVLLFECLALVKSFLMVPKILPVL
jgi:hypothetical protein